MQCFGNMADNLTLGEAARAIGVSQDTLRRWDRAGKLHTHRDQRNRRLVSPEEVQRLSRRRQRHVTGGVISARNRLSGIVRSVEVDGVMALVEIEAGPFLITAAVTRDSVEELGLVEGVDATATVKATSVMIERATHETTVAGRGSQRWGSRLRWVREQQQ
jgi:molybdopterin-binding protein